MNLYVVILVLACFSMATTLPSTTYETGNEALSHFMDGATRTEDREMRVRRTHVNSDEFDFDLVSVNLTENCIRLLLSDPTSRRLGRRTYSSLMYRRVYSYLPCVSIYISIT